MYIAVYLRPLIFAGGGVKIPQHPIHFGIMEFYGKVGLNPPLITRKVRVSMSN